MKPFKNLFLLLIIPLFMGCVKDQNPPVSSGGMYYPPMAHGTWNKTNPGSLKWNTGKLNNLNTYLKNKNTKGFIMLKDGKIVVEQYFNGHGINANWTWYSAAKSLTSTLVGIAQEENLLNIDDKTSTHLGENWSSLSKVKQDSIKVKHHITMSTGLQNPISDFVQWTCTAPSCFKYQASAGSRWAYHQGAFTLTQNILTKATGMDFKTYCKQKLQDKIGMNGKWDNLLDVRVFSSTTRSMARFGLLALNKGVWNEDTIYPQAYYNEMTNSSQDHNKAYGYLWWLNGKSDFLGTADQTLYNGPLIPNAPSDLFCALGAQDQKIYVIPSLNMVVVRSGEPAGNTEFANSSFDNELWGKIMEILP